MTTESIEKPKRKWWQYLLVIAVFAALICAIVFIPGKQTKTDDAAVSSNAQTLEESQFRGLLMRFRETDDIESLNNLWKMEFIQGDLVRGFENWQKVWEMLNDQTWPRLYKKPEGADSKNLVAETEGQMILYAEEDVLTAGAKDFEKRLWLLKNAKYLHTRQKAWELLQENDLDARLYPSFEKAEQAVLWLQTDQGRDYFNLMYGDQGEKTRGEKINDFLYVMYAKSEDFDQASETYFKASFNISKRVAELAKAKMREKANVKIFDHWQSLYDIAVQEEKMPDLEYGKRLTNQERAFDYLQKMASTANSDTERAEFLRKSETHRLNFPKPTPPPKPLPEDNGIMVSDAGQKDVTFEVSDLDDDSAAGK